MLCGWRCGSVTEYPALHKLGRTAYTGDLSSPSASRRVRSSRLSLATLLLFSSAISKLLVDMSQEVSLGPSLHFTFREVTVLHKIYPLTWPVSFFVQHKARTQASPILDKCSPTAASFLLSRFFQRGLWTFGPPMATCRGRDCGMHHHAHFVTCRDGSEAPAICALRVLSGLGTQERGQAKHDNDWEEIS